MVRAGKKKRPGRPPGFKNKKPGDVKVENGVEEKVENLGEDKPSFDGVKVEKEEENNGVVSEEKEEVTNLLKRRLRDGRRRVYYNVDQVFEGLLDDDFEKKRKRRKGPQKGSLKNKQLLTPENGNNQAEEMETETDGGVLRGSTRPKKTNAAAIEMALKKKKRETEDSNMCHQCQRNDKGRVVNCKSCSGRKRFCIPCITTWYPKMTEDEVAECCPFCRVNCNCKACLRMDGQLEKMKKEGEVEFNRDLLKPETIERMLKIKKSDIMFGEDEKFSHSKRILQALLPYMKTFSQEQTKELIMEASIRGISASEIKLQNAGISLDERIYCDKCRTSIVDFHRSCPNCKYDLCLSCCSEIRDGSLQGRCEPVIIEYVSRGLDYLHGGKPLSVHPGGGKQSDSTVETEKAVKSSISVWKANENGSIPCPTKELGGCGNGLLELVCMFSENWVADLVEKAENIAKSLHFEDMPESQEETCPCFNSEGQVNMNNGRLRKAASREDSIDNYLYNPTADEIQPGDLKHFQRHWANGEPVIVSNVLESACGCGLSWEPMVMWLAFRQITNLNHDQHLDITAIDCLDCCEVNVLTHTAEVQVKPESLASIKKLKQKHEKQDEEQLFGKSDVPEKNLEAADCGESGEPSDISANKSEAADSRDTGEPSDISENKLEAADGGALCDIFQREDVPKLEDYLKKHYIENSGISVVVQYSSSFTLYMIRSFI